MRVLIACEESQAVCIEFRKLGFEAFSCDILPCSGGHPEWHLQQDVTELLKHHWDLIIAFPPCTYLSNAGACRLYPSKGNLNLERYEKGLQGKEFFMLFYNNENCDNIAIENPVSSTIFDMPKHTQEVQPYQFGHAYTKKTRFWLKGLPLLTPTDIVKPETSYLPSGTSRKIVEKYGRATRTGKDAVIRSKTFPGIAKAMADQWGTYLLAKDIL